ncbi:uncharacterized protein LOC110099331 [Dendrobium catenatum]|uniref:uncharacterized protein LOC110099331 n=1 Tax=Dendrobium catenatum TaxID=906689 RepID=UPI0009F30241|nr:uncharacterized protein LOC110099331 [Dendrobium catenatum]
MLGVIPRIISEEQAAFVRGRSIFDHLLLAQEVFHKLRFSKACNGFLAIKVDMEQPYDSICWSTLKKMMAELGFPTRFIKLVMECILDPRYSILINGSNSNWIEGKSGFLQGHPLSPFLFILCSQLLSNAFHSRGADVGIRISSNSQKISHLLFADDILLFMEAKVNSMKKVKEILESYCQWTGQNISYHKSSFVCGSSVERRRKVQISRFMEIRLVEEFEYLGIKLALRCLRKVDFQVLLDKSSKKINAWGNRYISLAGRLVLVKSVYLSLPVFVMTHSLIPLKTLMEFEKLCRDFIWNKCDGKRGSLEDDNTTLDFFIFEGSWDREKLSLVFGTNLLNLICKVQIFPNMEEDCMELKYNTSGKSIFALVMEDSYNYRDDIVQINWVYKLKMNAKLEVFIWRLFLDALPTGAFLFRRKLSDVLVCPLGNRIKHGKLEESNLFIAISVLSFISKDNLHYVQSDN